MKKPITTSAMIAAGAIALTTTSLLAADSDRSWAPTSIAAQDRALSDFLRLNAASGARINDGGRVSRLYGQDLANGTSPEDTVENFLSGDLSMLGITRGELVESDRNGHGPVQPVGYLPETDSYKFTAFYFDQVRDGVPVYRTRLILLVRNEPGYPLVLVNTDVRNLGAFEVGLVDTQLPPAVATRAIEAFQATKQAGNAEAIVTRGRLVVWAGQGEALAKPQLAYEVDVVNELDEWHFVIDAQTNNVLRTEHMICFNEITGTVSGMATDGIATAECNSEIEQPLPYLEVTAGGTTVTTDANGVYRILGLIGLPVTVEATLNGTWFETFDFQTTVESFSQGATPPETVDFVFNEANNQEFIRAQVNAYLESNRVRDTAVATNPAYPTLMDLDFPVTVNRTDGFCPSNAWYSPSEESINFCSSAGSSNPNTAWSSVIHHEYGHHLVNAGGSQQGQYGEGMGDVMSSIILDTPALGQGWGGNCGGSLRSADNDMQYPCSGGIHFCGQLISGCVWDTRNELVNTEPDDYQEILAFLAVNAILVHSGDLITPDITIDWLTLDDDNGNIFDGTPHYTEIATGFGAHNMDAPDLALLNFAFPDGLPDAYSPEGGTTVRVEVSALSSTPVSDSGTFVIDTGSGPQSIAMTEVEPNVYEATFPATDCGTFAEYHFTVGAQAGGTERYPFDGTNLVALAGYGTTSLFEDDFENDNGWSVSNQGLSDGAWERGTPIGGGDRGDPPTDADGSGQCFLTDNEDGNSDVDGGTTTLTSPIMDASGGQALLSYARWYSNTFGGAPEADTFVVAVSDDAGASWTTLEVVGPNGPEVDGGWFNVQFDLNDVPGFTPNDQFRVRFQASDLGEGSVVEAGVDAVRLLEVECENPSIPGDLDGDGMVGFADLLQLLGAWGPCAGCPEDLDMNGEVDFSDLLFILSAWS